MIERNAKGHIIFESWSSRSVLLSSTALPVWLAPPAQPQLLKPVSYDTRRRDPETLDLFTGKPKP